MNVRSNVKKPFNKWGILSNAAHVKNILTVILLRQVDIIEQFGKPFQHPPKYESNYVAINDILKFKIYKVMDNLKQFFLALCIRNQEKQKQFTICKSVLVA